MTWPKGLPFFIVVVYETVQDGEAWGVETRIRTPSTSVAFIPLCLYCLRLALWHPEPGIYFYISKCESLPRTTNLAPSFSYRLERRDVLLPSDVHWGFSEICRRPSALIVRLKFGKTKGLLMFVVPIVGRTDYDSYLLLCSAALRPCLLSGGISNSRLAATDDARELIV